MTTSQASRIFGIPYNSLLMYVRGKYGKSLKLEQLRRDCISGPPIELLQMNLSHNNNSKGNANRNKQARQAEAAAAAAAAAAASAAAQAEKDGLHHMRHHHLADGGGGGVGGGAGGGPLGRSSSSEPGDLLPSPNAMFNPFGHGGFYPDFPFPSSLPLNMLQLLPDRHAPTAAAAAAAVAAAAAAAALNMSLDDDCKSDRSKHSLDDEYGSVGGGASSNAAAAAAAHQMGAGRSLERAGDHRHEDRREMLQTNGQD